MRMTQYSLQTLITPGLILGGVIILAFYSLLFLRDNSAPVVDLSDFQGSSRGFHYQVEHCWINDKKMAVQGWLVRERRGTSRRNLRVIVFDVAGNPHAIKTTLVQRNDVSELLSNRLGDGVDYRNAGFVASLNRTVADVELDHERMYLAYDDDKQRVLLPASCPTGNSP